MGFMVGFTTRGRSAVFGAGLAVAVLVALSGCAGSPSGSDAGATLTPTPTASSTASAPSPASSETPTPAPTDKPVVVEELAKGDQEAAVDVEVEGPTQVAFRRITLKPGGGTGLHCHDGQLVAVVEKGVFTHYAPVYPGGVHVYSAGDSIIEGAHYVHEGKNEGTEDVVLLVTYVIAEGEPLAETDLANCDAQ